MNPPSPQRFRRIRRAVRGVLEHGPIVSARWGWFRLGERYFDQHLGIETARPPELDAYGADAVRYEPLPYCLVRAALAAAIDPASVRRDVFLDAGLGRVVIMAATHPFTRVVGVELLERLSRLARRNLRAARPHLAAPAEVVTLDARQYEVPDDVSIINLFNPFTGEVMADVQRRIEASLRRRPPAPGHLRVPG